MPFPHPQILNAFLEHYKAKRHDDWVYFTTLKWLAASITPWSTHEEPDVKKQICDKLKTDIAATLVDGKSELEKWTQICITLGEVSTTTLKRNKDSLLAKYLQAMRTYILFKMNADEHIRNQLSELFEELNKKILPCGPAELKSSIETRINSEKTLLSLAYLGHAKSITQAREKKLLSVYPSDANDKLIYFDAHYFSLGFFNEWLKPNVTYTTFDEYETSLLSAEKKSVMTVSSPEAVVALPAAPSAESPVTIAPVAPVKPVAPVVPVASVIPEKLAALRSEGDLNFSAAPPPVVSLSSKHEPTLFSSARLKSSPAVEVTARKVTFRKPMTEVKLFAVNPHESKEEKTSVKGYNLRRRK